MKKLRDNNQKFIFKILIRPFDFSFFDCLATMFKLKKEKLRYTDNIIEQLLFS